MCLSAQTALAVDVLIAYAVCLDQTYLHERQLACLRELARADGEKVPLPVPAQLPAAPCRCPAARSPCPSGCVPWAFHPTAAAQGLVELL